MDKHFPIETPVPSEAINDFLSFDRRKGFADFETSDGSDRIVRVYFRGATLVRVLDEIAMVGELEHIREDGRTKTHWAYRVQGSPFEATQDKLWKEQERPISHYRFLTGSGCMDVLTNMLPVFVVV